MLEQEQFKSGIVLESITDGVMIINTSGTVQVLNQSAATMLGWKRDLALNLDYKSLIQVKSESVQTDAKKTTLQTDSVISQCLQSGTPKQGISLLKTNNDRQLYVDIVASPIHQSVRDSQTGAVSKKMVGVIAVLRDVDEQKKSKNNGVILSLLLHTK